MGMDLVLSVYGNEFGKKGDADPEYKRILAKVKPHALQAIRAQTSEEQSWGETDTPPEEPVCLSLKMENLYQFKRYAAHTGYIGTPPSEPIDENHIFEDESLVTYLNLTDEESLADCTLPFQHAVMTHMETTYLPIDFPEVIVVDLTDRPGELTFGSSYRLLDELNELAGHLGIEHPERLTLDDGWAYYDNEDDPWRFVRSLFVFLHYLSRESIKQKLSIRIME